MPGLAVIKQLLSMVLVTALVSGVAVAETANPLAGAHPFGVMKHKAGSGARAAWVFVSERPRLAPLPVVIFMHGYRALDPYDYGAWIDHLVRHGNVVIYPIYEATRSDDRARLLNQSR